MSQSPESVNMLPYIANGTFQMLKALRWRRYPGLSMWAQYNHYVKEKCRRVSVRVMHMTKTLLAIAGFECGKGTSPNC